MQEFIITKKVKSPNVNGVVEFKALTFPERIAISKASTVEASDGQDGIQFQMQQKLDTTLRWYELALKQVTKVDVTIVDEEKDINKTITSVDELMIYEQGTELVMDVAGMIVSGITLGNEKPVI